MQHWNVRLTMAYRQDPAHAPLARVQGRELEVPTGGRLPRFCTSCGVTRRLHEEEHEVEWRPAGGVVLIAFGPVGRALSEKLRRTALLTYSTCKECVRRQKDARDYGKLVIVGVLILGLVAATAGLNGYPFAGIAIAVGSVGGLVLVMTSLARRARALTVSYIHSNGTVSLRGVHAICARAAVENRRDAAGDERAPRQGEV